MTYLEYFTVGFVIDMLITGGWYANEKRWIFASAISAMLQTVLGYTVFYNLFPEGIWSIELFIFALGGGVGVALVVIIKKFDVWNKMKKLKCWQKKSIL